MSKSKVPVAASIAALLASPAVSAADATLRINIPAIEGVRVLRPYVAVWLEQGDTHAFAGNVAVWYDTKKRNNAGARWLSDLRSWWRAAGSQTQLPIDGVSGATRPSGEHAINLASTEAVQRLAPGNYEILVEVARERGGRDLVRLPLQWPPKASKQSQAQGEAELGLVQLQVRP